MWPSSISHFCHHRSCSEQLITPLIGFNVPHNKASKKSSYPPGVDSFPSTLQSLSSQKHSWDDKVSYCANQKSPQKGAPAMLARLRLRLGRRIQKPNSPPMTKIKRKGVCGELEHQWGLAMHR